MLVVVLVVTWLVIVVVDGVTRHEQAKLTRLGGTPFIGSSRSRLSPTGEPGDS